MFGRRELLASLAALALPSGFGEAAAPAADLIDLLYNLTWIPDGGPWEKHAYVVYAPWCPYCKRLYALSRPLAGRMQLRWIPAGSRTAQWRRYNAALGLSRDPRQLAAVFTAGRVTETGSKHFPSVDLNEGVIAAHSAEISELAGRTWGFPTVVYRSAAGVKGFTGIATNFEDRLATAVDDPRYPVDRSKSLELLRRSFSETPLLDNQHVRGRRRTDVHALPFADAPVIGRFDAGESRLALAEIAADGGRWVAIPFYRDDLRGYVPRAEIDIRT